MSDNDSDSDDFGAINAVQELNQDAIAKAAALTLVNGNPLKLFERKCKGNIKGGEEPAAVVEYLQKLFDLPYCFSKYSKKFLSCCCLKEIQENCPFNLVADRLSELEVLLFFADYFIASNLFFFYSSICWTG